MSIENYEVQLKMDKLEVQSVRLLIREVLFGAGLSKKVQGIELSTTLDNAEDRLLSQRARSFLNRLRKAEGADKFSTLNPASLVSEQEQKEALRQRRSRAVQPAEEEKQAPLLDAQSLKLLRKLRKAVNKTELFNVLVKKGPKDADAKRTIRHMVFPDAEAKSGGKDALWCQKKTFSRSIIRELLEEYKN